MAIFISDKMDFNTKIVTRDKGCYIRIKGLIHWNYIIPVGIYNNKYVCAPNIRAPKYMKQTEF